jgi:hypothetical protein
MLDGKNKIELFFFNYIIKMPSLIKRSNIKCLSSSADFLYNQIVQLIRLINIPIKIIKLIPLKSNKMINTNKYLYYHIIFKTLKTIYNKLSIYQKKAALHNKRIIRIDIYIDHKYLHSYSKLLTY